MLEKVNLTAAFATFSEHWSPRVAGEINDFSVKIVKLQGEFMWHHHDEEDELFLVVKGQLIMRLRDGDMTINEGEFLIVPHGVEHLPYAPEECHIMLLERAVTRNTGNLVNERTAEPKPL